VCVPKHYFSKVDGKQFAQLVFAVEQRIYLTKELQLFSLKMMNLFTQNDNESLEKWSRHFIQYSIP